MFNGKTSAWSDECEICYREKILMSTNTPAGAQSSAVIYGKGERPGLVSLSAMGFGIRANSGADR
jgi:hypothetical protein